jgi:hypothetical protein
MAASDFGVPDPIIHGPFYRPNTMERHRQRANSDI